MDLRINDRVSYDGSEGSIYLKKGEISYFIVAFKKDLDKVLIGGVNGGHDARQSCGVFFDHNGKKLEASPIIQGTGQYWWVGIKTLTKLNPIKLTKSQIKRIIKC
jgi:hypothetical protein